MLPRKFALEYLPSNILPKFCLSYLINNFFIFSVTVVRGICNNRSSYQCIAFIIWTFICSRMVRYRRYEQHEILFQWLWISNRIFEQDNEKWKIFQVLWWWSYYNNYHRLKLNINLTCKFQSINRQSLTKFSFQQISKKYLLKIWLWPNGLNAISSYSGNNFTDWNKNQKQDWYYEYQTNQT